MRNAPAELQFKKSTEGSKGLGWKCSTMDAENDAATQK